MSHSALIHSAISYKQAFMLAISINLLQYHALLYERRSSYS